MKTHTPNENQKKAVELWKASGGLLLRGDTGSGKTLVAIEGFKAIGGKVNLAVAPLHTFSGWERTLKGQYDEDIRNVNKSRKAGKEALADLFEGVPGTYFIGRELFRNIDWRRHKIDAVVLDEVHFIQNRKSKSFKTAEQLKRVPHKMGMSATPAGNNFQGMYAVSKFIFPGDIDNSFWRWVSDWCATEYDPYAYKKVTGELNPGEFVKSLPAYTYMPSPYTGKPITQYIDVELTPAQRKMYTALEKESIAWFEDNPTFVNLPSSLYMRLMQSLLAVPKITTWDDFNDKGEPVIRSKAEFPENTRSTKIDIFLDLLKDLPEDEPIICYTHSKIFAELLHKRLQKAKHSSKLFDSSQLDEHINGLGEDYRILISTQQKIGEGTDGLQDRCKYEVWFSFSDNGILNKQAAGRLNRQGQKEQVYRYVIRAKDTVETEEQHPRLKTAEQMLEESFNIEGEQ